MDRDIKSKNKFITDIDYKFGVKLHLETQEKVNIP